MSITLGLISVTPRATPQTNVVAEFLNWLPVTDAERSLKEPQVEKDAAAEVLLWRVRVVDQILGGRDLQRVLYNYVRVKVFDQKGQEKLATIDLTYREPGNIQYVSARTIKPDGTIVELDRKALNKRDLVRAGHAREKAVSFSMPGVEPGAILEYRWQQLQDDNRFRYLQLHFQRDLPVERVTYYFKPLYSGRVRTETLAIQAFHCQPTPIQLDPDGWNETSVEKLPALRGEPYSPSQPNVEQWALLYYRDNDTKDSKKFWNDESKKVYHEFKDALKINDEVKSASTEAIAGASNESDKISHLAVFVRKHLRQLGDPDVTSAEIQEYLEKLPKTRNRTSVEVLKGGLASQLEMSVAFAALTTAAGFDARLALIADKNAVAFNPQAMMDRYFLDRAVIALKLGDSWMFVDVGQKLVAPGSLPWWEEGVVSLIADPSQPIFVTTPESAPGASLDQHIASLKLTAQGGLEGSVEERYTGHRAEAERLDLANRSAAAREELFHDRLSHMFPESEVEDLKIENDSDASQPLRVTYRLKAPSFAQVTGKRILFQPNVFRRAQGSPFTGSDRKNMIEFPYAWKEVDKIEIELPPGFTVDNADNPGGMSLGATGSYQLKMSYTKDKPMVWTTNREFTFGEGGNLIFQVQTYPQIKRVFDTIRTRDTHTVSLKAD